MRSLSQFLKSVIQHRVGLFLVVIGFMAALALQWNGPQSIAVADEIAYIISGVNLVAQGEYTNPFGKPELWFPPVYPLLIGCLSLGGSLDAFLIARLISAVAAIATLLIVYQLVVQVFQQWSDKSHRQPDSSSTKTARGYALLAIVFLASNPTFQHYGTRALSESLAACLSLSALCVWVCRTRSIKNAFVIGGLIGAATLTRPECVLVLPLWLGFELFRCRDRLAVNRSVAAGCTTLVLLLPYVLFLHSHTGRWSISNKGPVNLAAGRAAFHQSPREFINPESLVMGFYEYDTSLAVESQRYLFNASKLAASFSEIYFRWWVAALIVVLIAAGWRHLCRPESVPIDSIPGDSKSKRAHAKRVCSDRFSYISAPIGAFGAQINQPLVASGCDSARSIRSAGHNRRRMCRAFRSDSSICSKSQNAAARRSIVGGHGTHRQTGLVLQAVGEERPCRGSNEGVPRIAEIADDEGWRTCLADSRRLERTACQRHAKSNVCDWHQRGNRQSRRIQR
jgi:hypothetical protein